MFNKRLKELRNQANMTQRELGEKLDLAHNAIANYEKGERHPDFDTILKLADIFNCSIDYLLGRTNNKNEKLMKPNEGQALIIKAKNANVSINELEAYIEARKKIQNNKD